MMQACAWRPEPGLIRFSDVRRLHALSRVVARGALFPAGAIARAGFAVFYAGLARPIAAFRCIGFDALTGVVA